MIIHGRNQANAEEVAKNIGNNAGAVSGDLGIAKECDALLNALVQYEPINILVNNAGIFETKDFVEISDEDWLHFFNTNVMSGVRLTRALLPGMLKRNWGRVVFISSESGMQIPKEMIHYGMTKSAQLSISRGIAELTKGTNVTVNSVLPGPTFSDGVEPFLQDIASTNNSSLEETQHQFVTEHRPTSLIGRFATCEEAAAMVTYVVSPLASATNGAALRVDGGVVNLLI